MCEYIDEQPIVTSVPYDDVWWWCMYGVHLILHNNVDDAYNDDMILLWYDAKCIYCVVYSYTYIGTWNNDSTYTVWYTVQCYCDDKIMAYTLFHGDLFMMMMPCTL